MLLITRVLYESVPVQQSILFLCIALLSYPVGIVSQSICRGFERLHFVAFSVILGSIVRLSLGVVSLLAGYGILVIIIIHALSYIVINFSSLLFAIKCIKKNYVLNYKIDFKFLKYVVGSIPIFALILILGTVRGNIDVLIINKFSGATETGFYSAAIKMVNILNLSLSSFILALQPVIFKMYKNSFLNFQIITIETIRLLFTTTLPIIMGTLMIGDQIVVAIFGNEFEPAYKALVILIVIIPIFGLNQLFANTLIAAGHERINLFANALGMIISFGLNIVLIKIYGFIGASIACVSSGLITCIYQYYFF